MVAAPPSDASRGGGPPEKAGVKSPSLASESDYNGSEIEPEPWEVLETLRAENERLRADLAALRREGAREEPTSGTASAPMAPVAAGDGPLKNFGKDGPGAPGKLSDAATLPESSVLEPPTVRVTLAPYATALIRQAITTIVFNGNVPLTIPQIVSAVRKRVNAAGTSEDLGVTFETDPTATMGAAIRAFVLKTKSEHHPPLFVRIREGGKSRFFIDMVPAAVAQGSLVEFVESDDIKAPEVIFSTKTVSTSDLPTGTASSTSKPCPTIPTTPKDADPDSLYHSLSYREAQLCRQLKMKPSVFIQASTSLEDECKRRNGLIEKEAAAIVSWFNWIPSQWTQFWGFLLRWGYVWLRHTGKRRRRPAEGEASDDEGPTLFPAIPFCRTVEEANRAAADVYRSLYSMDADGASIADSEEGTRGRPPPSSGFRASPNNYRNVGLGRAPPKKIKVTTADMLVVQMTDGARYRMICPTCGKRHFNNLQGFVNHCRISHNLYFPSHADAVLKCGEKLEGGGVKQEGQNDAAEEHAEPTIAAVENEGGVLNGSLSAKMLLYRKKPAGTVSLKRTRQDGKFARVVCPNCGRNDFLSMQGFLKHLNMHGIFVTVPEAIELYGVVNEEAEVASLPADAEPTVTVTAPDDAENGESSNAAAAEPEPSEPPRPPLVGVDPTDLVIRKADGNYVKVVCPDCGRSNFANLQVFVHHLAVSHDGTFESLEQYSQPLKIAKPPAARPPPLPGTNFKLKFKFKVPKMSLPVQQRFAHTPLGRSEGGSPPGSASGSPGYEQYTRSGGPRVAAGANFSPGGGRRPPPRPLDIDHLPDVDRLNEDEREICRTNRLVPQNYLSIKDLFVTECQKRGGLGKRSAREMVKMDVNKSSKIWEYLQMQGLVWPPSGSKN